jgi:hypothetical protein
MLPHDYSDDGGKKRRYRRRIRRSKSFHTISTPIISVCVIVILSFILLFLIIFFLLPTKKNNTVQKKQVNGPVFSSRSFTYEGTIKSMYSFKQKVFLEDNMKTYSFAHERLYQFNQDDVIDYELCCIVFIKSVKDSEYLEYSKICGSDNDLQCIISNNRLLVNIDMSFLEEGSDVEIVLSCVFDWLSLPRSEQTQTQKQRVDFHEKDFFGA